MIACYWRSLLLTVMLFQFVICKEAEPSKASVPASTSSSRPGVLQYLVGRVDVQGIRVFYQTAKVKNVAMHKLPILFLHGAAFTSQTWRKLGTLRYLARRGYSPIAVDLPGYGRTKGYVRGNTNEFIDDLISSLNISRPILVSPSMSGRYSIPYVLERTSNLRGYIPVAPSNYGGTATKFGKLTLPALIVYGSRDYYGKKTSEMIANIPGSKQLVIPNGGHPAYLDNPRLFHTSVKAFLDGIYTKEKRMMQLEMAKTTVQSFANSTSAIAYPTNATVINTTTPLFV